MLQVATATLVSERRRHRCAMFQASFWRSPMSPNLPHSTLSGLRPQALSRPIIVLGCMVSLGATEYFLVPLVSSDRAVAIRTSTVHPGLFPRIIYAPRIVHGASSYSRKSTTLL